jgi:hypothetical protein
VVEVPTLAQTGRVEYLLLFRLPSDRLMTATPEEGAIKIVPTYSKHKPVANNAEQCSARASNNVRIEMLPTTFAAIPARWLIRQRVVLEVHQLDCVPKLKTRVTVLGYAVRV